MYSVGETSHDSVVVYVDNVSMRNACLVHTHNTKTRRTRPSLVSIYLLLLTYPKQASACSPRTKRESRARPWVTYVHPGMDKDGRGFGDDGTGHRGSGENGCNGTKKVFSLGRIHTRSCRETVDHVVRSVNIFYAKSQNSALR